MNNDASRFLELLYGSKPEKLFILLWTLEGKISRWYLDWKQAAESIPDDPAQTINLYCGIGLSPESFGPKERCGADKIAGIIGFGCDADVAGPGHNKKKYPPTQDDAIWLLHTAFEPSIVTFTGHGVQGIWLFKEPYIFADAADRAACKETARLWHEYLLCRAEQRGWSIDSVFDLARIYRVAGTLNQKPGLPDIASHILTVSDARYLLSDFTEFLTAIPALGIDMKAQVNTLVAPPPIDDHIAYNPNAEISHDLFNALWTNDLRFRVIWERQRHDLRDDSQSGYDLALANLFWDLQLPDQQAADAIVHLRRHANAPPKNDWLYYLKRTLTRARTRAYVGQAPTATALQASIQAVLTGEVPGGGEVRSVERVPPPTPVEPPSPTDVLVGDPRNKDTLVRRSRQAFNECIDLHINGEAVEVIRCVRIEDGDDTTWRLELANGRIVTLENHDDYQTFRGFRAAVGKQVNGIIRHWKLATWEIKVVPAFMLSLITEQAKGDNGGDARQRMTDLVDAYLSVNGITTKEQAFSTPKQNGLVFIEGGLIAIYAEHMLDWVLKNRAERLTKRKLTAGLDAIGAHREPVWRPEGRTNQQRWFLPVTWVAETYITAQQRDRINGNFYGENHGTGKPS